MLSRLLARLVSLAVLVPVSAFAQNATPPTAVPAPAPDFAGNVFQMLFGLAVVLVLLVGALWLLKQLTQRRGEAGGLMRVVSATAVGTRERVVIVEVGSTWLVLGVAPGRVSPLAEIPRQAEPPAPERRPATPDFPGWLRNLGGNRAPRR